MDDLFNIIRLINVRIEDVAAISAIQVAVGDRTRCALYHAQGVALKALASDLAAAMIPDREPGAGRDTRSVLLVEMGGQMSATVIDDEDVEAVARRFRAEHRALLADGGHAQWDIMLIEIPPLDAGRQRRTTGLLDVRHALVTWTDGALRASIHNAEADLNAARAEFQRRYAFEIEDGEASCHSHVILIPARGSGNGTRPADPC